MLTAIREAQLPLLAAVLLGACGTKQGHIEAYAIPRRASAAFG